MPSQKLQLRCRATPRTSKAPAPAPGRRVSLTKCLVSPQARRVPSLSLLVLYAPRAGRALWHPSLGRAAALLPPPQKKHTHTHRPRATWACLWCRPSPEFPVLLSGSSVGQHAISAHTIQLLVTLALNYLDALQHLSPLPPVHCQLLPHSGTCEYF
jgi:hypothetical protein